MKATAFRFAEIVEMCSRTTNVEKEPVTDAQENITRKITIAFGTALGLWIALIVYDLN
jgi:hypothetical protein